MFLRFDTDTIYWIENKRLKSTLMMKKSFYIKNTFFYLKVEEGHIILKKLIISCEYGTVYYTLSI